MENEQGVKIKGVQIRNFAKVRDLTIEFDENKVTRMIGMNGDGKTTVVKAIHVAFKGLASRGKDGQLIGDRFRFIGETGKSSDIIVRLVDKRLGPEEIVITRHITKDTCTLDFTAPDEYNIDADWLKGLLSVAFMSAKNFGQLSGQEQTKLLGIDTSEYDVEIAELKENATHIRREIKAFGTLAVVEKVEPVDVNTLYEDRDEIRRFNSTQYKNEQSIVRYKNEQQKCKERIIQIKNSLAFEEGVLEELKCLEKIVPLPKERKPEFVVEVLISGAAAENRQHEAYKTYVVKAAELSATQDEFASNIAAQQKATTKRLNYIKGFDFGFKGLTIGDDGGLLYKGNHLNLTYLSNGELEVIVAKLRKSTRPDLKVTIIDDFDLIDKIKGPALIKDLLDDGYQVIVSEVGNKKKGKNSVVLRDCGIAGEEKDEGKDLL